MATITKRGNTWRLEIRRKGHKRVSKTFNLKREAEKFAASIEHDAQQLTSLSNQYLNSTTLSDAIAEYLDQHTGKDFMVPSRLQFWAEQLGEKHLSQITSLHIRTILRSLAKKGKTPATINRSRAALSAVYSYVSDEYGVTTNPAKEVKQLKEDNARTRFLTDTERTALLTAAKQSNWDRLYLLVLMALVTGARRTELLTLRWSDLDLTQRTAHVADTKNGQPRVLVLTDELVTELRNKQEIGSGYVFPKAITRAATTSNDTGYFRNFDKHWYACLEEAGVSNFRFHDLRHTTASILAMNGASLLEIADVLGHKSIQMTQRYAHLCTQHKAALVDRVMGKLAQ